jgi:hypothetical protein
MRTSVSTVGTRQKAAIVIAIAGCLFAAIFALSHRSGKNETEPRQDAHRTEPALREQTTDNRIPSIPETDRRSATESGLFDSARNKPGNRPKVVSTSKSIEDALSQYRSETTTTASHPSDAELAKALARERVRSRNILKNYKDRTAEADSVEGDEADAGIAGDSYAPAGADAKDPEKAEQYTVEQIAEIGASDSSNEEKIRIYQEALDPGNPLAVRIQALNLLYEIAPENISQYRNDSDESIRLEAERLLSDLKNP